MSSLPYVIGAFWCLMGLITLFAEISADREVK